MTRTALTFALALLATPAVGQPAMCLQRDRILAKLANDYGEARASVGIHKNGAVLETFVNPETGSWTMVMTAPNGSGVSCVVAAGDAWQEVDEPPADPET